MARTKVKLLWSREYNLDVNGLKLFCIERDRPGKELEKVNIAQVLRGQI